MSAPQLYARTPGASGDWQLLKDDLLAVAQQAQSFAEPFQASGLAYWAGLWHDLGKGNPSACRCGVPGCTRPRGRVGIAAPSRLPLGVFMSYTPGKGQRGRNQARWLAIPASMVERPTEGSECAPGDNLRDRSTSWADCSLLVRRRSSPYVSSVGTS